ncbi:MAG: hydrogen peroxide-dependent heme synthase [Bryobacteraceae bacterium]
MSSAGAIPAVPLTLEGAWLLHQMARVRWTEWSAATPAEREAALGSLRELTVSLEAANSALFRQFGHRGDLMFIHFRPAIDDLHQAENAIAKSKIGRYLDVVHSYLSVVELGLYESSVKTYEDLTARGLKQHTEEWDAGIKEVLDRQRSAMEPRLNPQIPAHRYACFYPMNRRRGEQHNWYSLPIEERARLMHEHGMTGRRYHGKVRQVISGSVGLDDWEWGVDLFSDDPLVFKELVYVMRFDPVSALYAEFGEFFVGTRSNADELCQMFAI